MNERLKWQETWRSSAEAPRPETQKPAESLPVYTRDQLAKEFPITPESENGRTGIAMREAAEKILCGEEDATPEQRGFARLYTMTGIEPS